MPRDGTRTCGGCRYWSEMLAHAGAGTDNPAGDVEAMCIVAGGPHSSRYTVASTTCEKWASGHLGAIDDPEYHGPDEAPYAEEQQAYRDKREDDAAEEHEALAHARCPDCGAPVDNFFDHVAGCPDDDESVF